MIVTVFMPAYNASEHIAEAINSILNQTYQDFKLLIINDGSTDGTEEIIKSYYDPRIEYIKKEKNTGLINTLNQGFKVADSKYLIRMDADDISPPQRVKELITFMDNHPEIDICGTSYESINEHGIVPGSFISRPKWHDEICTSLLSNCTLTHGTAIFRLESWKKAYMQYPEDYIHAEDYKMLTEAAQKLTLHNLQESLYYYRIHPNQVSSKHYSIQRSVTDKIKLEQLNALDVRLTPEQELTYIKFIWGKGIDHLNHFGFIKSVIKQMLENNKSLNRYNQQALEKHLKYLLSYNTMLFFIRKQYSPAVIKELFNNQYKPWKYLKPNTLLAVILKSFIFHKA